MKTFWIILTTLTFLIAAFLLVNQFVLNKDNDTDETSENE